MTVGQSGRRAPTIARREEKRKPGSTIVKRSSPRSTHHERMQDDPSLAATIRSATRDDAPEIARLIRALAEYENLESELHASEERLRAHLFGDRPLAEAIVAEAEGRIVGFAIYFSTYSTFRAQPGIWLEDLFVEEGFRGRALGRKLVERVIAIAKERGCGRVEWTALEWNTKALEFYRRTFGAQTLRETIVHRISLPAPAERAARSDRDG